MEPLIKTHSHLKIRDQGNLDTFTLTPRLKHTHTHQLWSLNVSQACSLPPSLSLPKIPHCPSPATRAVYHVIIVWLQRFIICTDWVTTNGKGQALLTHCSRNIFPHRPHVCPPSRSSERANCKCICLRRRNGCTRPPQIPQRGDINAFSDCTRMHTLTKPYTWEQFGTRSNHIWGLIAIKHRFNSFYKTILDNMDPLIIY